MLESDDVTPVGDEYRRRAAYVTEGVVYGIAAHGNGEVLAVLGCERSDYAGFPVERKCQQFETLLLVPVVYKAATWEQATAER